MECVSEIDKYMAGCVEQIRAIWQDLRHGDLLTPGEESERQQSLQETLTELAEKLSDFVAG